MLGTRIRELRIHKGLTLGNVAELTELTASYLSQVERGLIEPSLSSLRKISAAFDVPIYTFLKDEENELDHILIQADRRKVLELPGSNIRYEFLTPTISDKNTNCKMELIYFKLDADSWSSEDFLIHDADECIFIIEGRVEVYLGDKIFPLNTGDSIYISEQTPHKIFNPTNETVTGISSISPAIY